MEIWRSIKGFEGIYEVSNLGNVRRLPQISIGRNQHGEWSKMLPERVFTPSLDSKGYPQVVLTIGGKRTARVHRLVAEAFLPSPSELLTTECSSAGVREVLVNHKDGNKTNNNIKNLEWCSPTYNNLHCIELGSRTQPKGREVHSNILDESAVLEIYRLAHLELESQESIAERFGVKQITVSNIKTGRSWHWLTGHSKTARTLRKDRENLSIAEQ